MSRRPLLTDHEVAQLRAAIGRARSQAPKAPEPNAADRTLNDAELLALRRSVLLEGLPLAKAAATHGICVDTAARYCSSDTRFTGSWPEGVRSVPPLAVVRARG